MSDRKIKVDVDNCSIFAWVVIACFLFCGDPSIWDLVRVILSHIAWPTL